MRAVRVINTPPAKPISTQPEGPLVPLSSSPPPVSPFVAQEEQAYQQALETLRTQRLVIDTLNDTLQRRSPPEPLLLDAGTQSEASREGALTIVAKAERCAELHKWQLRRAAATAAYARRIALLQDDLQGLRRALSEVESSKQPHIQGIAREGRTRDYDMET